MYISEGIPYGFTSTAIVAYLRSQGVALDDIGLLVAALFLPWSFKWAWAPLVDLFRLNKFGGRKLWIVFCTCMMMLSLLTLLWLDMASNFMVLLGIVVVHNVFAATQDVAIDSLAVSSLKPEELSRGNGFMFGGQYFGIALGGAGSIALFGLIGFNMTLLVMCLLLMANLLFILLFVKDPDVGNAASEDSFLVVIKSFFRELFQGFLGSGRGPLVALAICLLPIGTMALAYATLATIQVDYGLAEAAISKITGANTILAAIGCIVGGYLGDKFGIRRVLFVAYILTAIPTLILAFSIQSVGLVNISFWTLATTIAAHGFFYGVTFGVFAAVMMGVTNPAVGATMFTAYMAMSNLTISYTNFWQGQVSEATNYSVTLFIDAAVMIIPLILIPFLLSRADSIKLSKAAQETP